MVRFFSFFFLMIRFDQTFHLMLFFLLLFLCDFIGLPSVLPNCRVDIYPSWIFLDDKVGKLGCFLIAGLT